MPTLPLVSLGVGSAPLVLMMESWLLVMPGEVGARGRVAVDRPELLARRGGIRELWDSPNFVSE